MKYHPGYLSFLSPYEKGKKKTLRLGSSNFYLKTPRKRHMTNIGRAGAKNSNCEKRLNECRGVCISLLPTGLLNKFMGKIVTFMWYCLNSGLNM